jgi:hypothetical protein
MYYLTGGGAVTSATEESPIVTTVAPTSGANELGKRLMETADNMAHDMGIPTPALIAIIVGKYTFSI